jgi:methylated-DNA-[protein]-cysteine S-methyltransferase
METMEIKESLETVIQTAFFNTPLGSMQASACGDALTGLWFCNQRFFPQDASSWIAEPDNPVLYSLRQWLDAYFAGKRPVCTLSLAPQGSVFRQAVWRLLLTIPYGQTLTYGELAEKIAGTDKKPCAQAVGGAVGHNPISLIIPCHRVIGANGSLTGYGGGLDRKKALLELESRPVEGQAEG